MHEGGGEEFFDGEPERNENNVNVVNDVMEGEVIRNAIMNYMVEEGLI